MSPQSVYSQVYSTIPKLPGSISVPSPVLASSTLIVAKGSLPILLIVRPQELLHLLPHVRTLATTSIVLQVSTKEVAGDHAKVTSLRGSGLSLLYSNDSNTAQTHALVAARVAATGHGVVHFGEFDEQVYSPAEGSVGSNYVLSKGEEPYKSTNGHHAPVNGNGSNGVLTNGASLSQSATSSIANIFNAAFASLPAPLSAKSLRYVGSTSPRVLLIALGSTSLLEPNVASDTALISLNLYRPLSSSQLQNLIPRGTQVVVVLEQSYSSASKWGPLFLDVASAYAESENDRVPALFNGTLGHFGNGSEAITIIENALARKTHHFVIGTVPSLGLGVSTHPTVIPKHESTYRNLLTEVFGSRLWVANAPSSLLPSSSGPTLSSSSLSSSSSSSSSNLISATSPEYALGHVLGAEQKRQQLRQTVRAALADPSFGLDENSSTKLASWLQNDRDERIGKAAAEAAATSSKSELTIESDQFVRKSNWIIGSEAWSHDLGASGLHHALSTGADVNLLLIDTTPYHYDSLTPPSRLRKKDAGLYAMTYGGAYVASVAVYGDFAQTLRAFAEADAFKGPSIILAYLPSGQDDSTRALDMLKMTKKAIEVGTWPLYRWDPSVDETKENRHVFELDSEKIKADLRTFLDRQNHLTELSNRLPNFGDALESGSGKKMVEAQKKKALAAFEALSNSLDGPPLLILYASDGGNAEKLAKKFAVRAKQRGVAARTLAMDDLPIEDLPLETNVAFFTSVAGQGEFPQNGREFWKAIQAGKVSELSNVQYSVFGLGDSHYWPRKEDAHYYNKSSKDLNAALKSLKANEIVELGLGDDQDPDGPQTAYKLWEPAMWKALGVDNVQVDAGPELEPITNEHIKIASNYLRGTIKEGLVDQSTGALAESDGQLTKFHGIYQQDDRDIRDERKAAGLEPAYSFMVRMRLPAGVCKPDQWLAVDAISDKRGNSTFKLTTRQTFQFHGIVKNNLKPAIQEINRMMLDTIAACGDVNRTVMCSANPSIGKLHSQVFAFASELSDQLKPQTSAYSEIWLDKKLVVGEAVQDVEPMYGEYYLPRKFKIAIAVPPYNDVDVYCHDLGYIAILDEKKELLGFNVTIGGGMGVTHSMKTTYPRLADVVGFITPDQGLAVAKAVLITQRDNGNRANRKNARVKYTVDRMGIANFVAEVEQRWGQKFQPTREFVFTSNTDAFGWQTGHDGRRHFTAFVENGRVQDEPGKPFKTALREIAKVHKGVFRLTANQHLIIADIPPEEETTIQKLLTKYHLDNVDFSALRLSSAACVAFPTCGLAMAESERYLPVLIDKVEKMIEEVGLRNDSITMRMTGCPNGCARPWAAEVAFVGKAPGSYLMLLGGGYYGQRLNKIYREAVNEEEILQILQPMIKSYAVERLDGEHFGDFVIRKGIISATKSGKEFYDGSSPGVEA